MACPKLISWAGPIAADAGSLAVDRVKKSFLGLVTDDGMSAATVQKTPPGEHDRRYHGSDQPAGRHRPHHTT